MEIIDGVGRQFVEPPLSRPLQVFHEELEKTCIAQFRCEVCSSHRYGKCCDVLHEICRSVILKNRDLSGMRDMETCYSGCERDAMCLALYVSNLGGGTYCFMNAGVHIEEFLSHSSEFKIPRGLFCIDRVVRSEDAWGELGVDDSRIELVANYPLLGCLTS
ncbi:unnamed protein product [Cochlearia groenlandica]